MIVDLKNLPAETKALHHIIFALDAEKNSFLEKAIFLEEKDRAQSEEILKIKEQLRLLRNKQYGKSSEKVSKEKSDELQKDIEGLELRALLQVKF